MDVAAKISAKPLQVSRYYPATREQIYAAWTNPEALSKWFGPASHRCRVEHMDVREGGEYRIRMIPTGTDTDCGGDGSKDSVCGGKYLTLDPPEKIVMSFSWLENGSDIGTTTLTIELFETADGTQLVLTHAGLPNDETSKAHQHGWDGSLVKLAGYLQ